MSIKELDILIEQALKEREYVTGSRLPTKQGESDFSINPLRAVSSPTAFQEGVKTMAQFCQTATSNTTPKEVSKKFERLVAIEMMHKFLNMSIPDTDAIGFSPKRAGFGLEKILGSFLGGKVMPPGIQGSSFFNAEDLVFDYQGNEGFYSLKFFSEDSLKKYGFGQAMTTFIGWLEGSKASQQLKYGIFVKSNEKSQVGFKAYYKTFKQSDIKNKIDEHLLKHTGLNYDAHKKKIQEAFKAQEGGTIKYQQMFENYFMQLLKENNELKSKIILGKLEDLGEPFAVLSMPRSIDDLTTYIFNELGQDINELYESLDGFKDELEKYFKSEKKEPENTAKKLEMLKMNWDNVSGPSYVNESKLQSIDDLIAETIRDIKKSRK